MREIETLDELDAHLARVGDLRDVVLQGLDLSGHAAALAGRPCDGAVFLGCRLPAALARGPLIDGGALVFPRIAGLPYDPYRARLYDPRELVDGFGTPEGSRDERIYRHYVAQRDRAGGPSVMETLAERLHDHAIDDALGELLAEDPRTGRPRQVVAIMGGHALGRDGAPYRTVARLAQLLAACDEGYFLVSGGGPGAMEATHLGAWLSGHGEAALDEAIAILAKAPSYRDAGWTETALAVRERFACGAESLGIPTWFYGHEPPNLFASHVAKYFANSIREDGLLAIARHGVVYTPGSAGTIQEIFMDAAQNHYATYEVVSPMVFLGTAYWREEKPVYPLLERLAAGHPYARLLAIADDPATIVDYLRRHPPEDPSRTAG